MNKILISTLCASAVLFSACEDNLDIPQKGVTPIENFYNTDEDAEQALVSAYTGFIWNVCGFEAGYIYVPTYQVSVQCGDDLFAAGSNFGDNDNIYCLNEFRFDAGNGTIQNAYQNYYYAMYYSNLVIDHFKDSPSSKAKKCVAEARVLRAYMHMMLALGWGNPPKIDHVLGGGDLPENCEFEDLLTWCAEECEEAAAVLDERKGPSDKAGAAKVTKGFAWGVAGKCWLYIDKWDKAKENLKKVITSGNYKLVPGARYAENFHVEGDLNEEKIFEANIAYDKDLKNLDNRTTWMQTNLWGWRSDHMNYRVNQNEYTGIEGWGGCGVPKSFADEFVANDGLDSYRLNASIISIEDLMYGKLQVWKPIEGMSLDEIKKSDKIGLTALGLYGQSKYLMLKKQAKASDMKNPGDNHSMANHTIMRYAEVLLMYAEACIQSGDQAEAKKYINEIQERAGSKTISATVDMNVLKREKKLEMWLEGCRYYDMRHWEDWDLAKKAGKEVTSLYDKLSRPIKAGDKVIEDGERFYTILDNSHQVPPEGWSEKFRWFPFPSTVVSINPNLKQHEGF